MNGDGQMVDGLATSVGRVSNAAAEIIGFTAPYAARVVLCGTATVLFHAWSNEAVAERSNAAKGSKVAAAGFNLGSGAASANKFSELAVTS